MSIGEPAATASAAPAVALPGAVRARRGVAAVVWLVVVLAELMSLLAWHVDERVLAATRNLIFPGLGFVDGHVVLALVTASVAAAAIGCWLAWGTDWLVAVVWVGAVLAALFVVPAGHEHTLAADAVRFQQSSHEFAAVMALAGALRWLRLRTLGRLRVRGVGGRRGARATLGAVDRCRVAAIAGLAEGAGVPTPEADASRLDMTAPDVERRARRIQAFARFRWRRDPLAHDMAPVHAALVLGGRSTPSRLTALRADAARRWTGVPASEPTWVRPLDATLVAAALWDLGEHEDVQRWRTVFDNRLRLRHGRRPAWLHAPLAVAGGAAPWWEHATTTALARGFGWVGDDDWATLRRPCLGAAARGARSPHDARLVAAGRLWAALAADGEATRLLSRPQVRDDAMAATLDRLADACRVEPGCLRRPQPVVVRTAAGGPR